jgi:hypothetical protein
MRQQGGSASAISLRGHDATQSNEATSSHRKLSWEPSSVDGPGPGWYGGPVGVESVHHPFAGPSDPPPVVVHQPVVERAGQDEVLRLVVPTVCSPPCVVDAGEHPGRAPGEHAPPVPVLHLAAHPRSESSWSRRKSCPPGPSPRSGPRPCPQARRQLPRRPYLKARPSVRRRFNEAVLEGVYVKDRRIARAEFSDVFRASFLSPEFE